MSSMQRYRSITIVVVDALFGSGLNRPAEGIYAIGIDAINHEKRVSPETLVVSVDIPFGTAG
jgi:NAD(P)H-hydrate repair Nnr-like enzyme with NAD(P)H-hydrate epimerase domain